MLHKSFKPAKCKISLKLAASRVKLMKNKREVQVKQLKRELAQLLESGQEQTARIRVEHVVREEKTTAAYDLLEIYCELIVARLPIIESQKNCPIDLKEAIASVIFASPRCADIPELADVRKHFTAKYGKDFVSAAVELRPDCGVSRLLVEKLSAKAPDGPTKIKILTAIAEEHNIKWDPKAFGEKDLKPPVDLLNGPNTFLMATQVLVDPPTVQATPNIDEKGHPGVQIPPRASQIHDVPQNFYEQNARSHHPQSSAATNVGVNKSMSSASSHSKGGPSGYGTEDVEFRNSHSRGGDASTLGRQNWNMEFKDATAAAQAAAESAERASMAARAAAELSSRGNMTRQYSTDSQKSSAYGLRDENPQKYTGPTLQSEYPAKVPKDDILLGRNPSMQYKKFRDDEVENQTRAAQMIDRDGLKSSSMSSQSASLRSSTGFVDDNQTSVNNFQMAGRDSQKNLYDWDQSDSVREVSTKKQPSRSEVEYLDEGHDNRNSEDVHYFFEDKRASRQSSRASSHSRSGTVVDDNVVSNEMYHKIDNQFFTDNRIDIEENTHKGVSHSNASAVFDDSGSDDDQYRFDMVSEHKEHEFYFGFSSPGRKLPFVHTGFQSFSPSTDEVQKRSNSQTHDSTVFSTNVTSSDVPSQSDNLPPVTFDDSEGPSSESEGEQENSKPVGGRDEGTFTHEQNMHSRDSELAQDKDHEFSSSSFAAKTESKFGHGDGTTRQSSPGIRKSQNDNRDSFNKLGDNSSSRVHEVMDNVHLKDTDFSTESTLESGNQLNFGMLTGGLRNKGNRRPPYTRSSAGIASATKPSAEGISSKVEQSSPTLKASISISDDSQQPDNQRVSAEANKKTSTGASATDNDSSDDHSEDDLSQQTFSTNEKRYVKNAVDEESQRSSSRPPVMFFDSENSDSKEVIPKQTSAGFARPNAGFSRRTKATPVNSKRNSDSRATVLSETSVTPDRAAERKTFAGSSYSIETQPKQVSQDRAVERKTVSGSFYSTETRPKLESQRKSSEGLGSSIRPKYPAQTASEPVLESKRSSREESSKASAREQAVSESKKSSREDYFKPPARESPSSSLPKTGTSGSTATSRTTSSSRGTPSGETATHVHPKLPDYDSLAAHFQSLRQSRD